MDKVAATTALIRGIVDVYDNETFQSQLNEVLKKLISEFNNILSQYAEEYKLITSNSVRPVEYFTVVGRIKERDSFHEKMIRGNLIYSFLEVRRFRTKAEILKSGKRVQNIIKKIFEDIIGVKILTEVEADCKEVMSLLKDKHSTLFNDKSFIYLDLDDLEKQPVKMRNGLEFYKIRGVFRGTFKFELQIKSKLLSVWGDMDHSMFYKDYSVSPLRGNVKQSMVNLGGLIFQVDKCLLQIREAEESFSENREVIDFVEKFSTQYSNILEQKLGFGYRLEDISEFLFYLYKNRPESKGEIKASLDFSLLATKGSDELVRHYAQVRDKDFNLQIIELIYFNWFSRRETNKQRKENNFNREIPKLIVKYLTFLGTHLQNDIESSSSYLKENFSKVCPYLNSGMMLYSFEKINSFFSILSPIITYSDIEQGKYTNEQIDDVRNFLLLIYYKENAEDYLRDRIEHIDLNDLIRTLTSTEFSPKGKKMAEIQTMSSAYELMQKGLIMLQKCVR